MKDNVTTFDVLLTECGRTKVLATVYEKTVNENLKNGEIHFEGFAEVGKNNYYVVGYKRLNNENNLYTVEFYAVLNNAEQIKDLFYVDANTNNGTVENISKGTKLTTGVCVTDTNEIKGKAEKVIATKMKKVKENAGAEIVNCLEGKLKITKIK